ncbi:MAG: hypothetical protein Q9175_002922 [Cornicularia normoerica]
MGLLIQRLEDENLVQQVQLQLIVEKTNLDTWKDGATEVDEHIKAPPLFYLQALHSQLKDVHNKLAAQSQRNEVVLAHLYSTELAINEIAFSQVPIITNHSSLKQLKRLCACVESAKSWFEVFSTVPPLDYIGFPFSIFSQLVHCLATLYRLSTLNDPAWDKNGVKETADLLLILDQVINSMERVATLAGLDNNGSIEGDVFSRTAKKFRSIRLQWKANLGPDDLMVSTIPTPLNANETPLPEAFPLDFPDNDWMMDFLLDPNY